VGCRDAAAIASVRVLVHRPSASAKVGTVDPHLVYIHRLSPSCSTHELTVFFFCRLWQLGRGDGPMSSRHLIVLEGRLPHGVLLPYCAAMLHHGGAGTTYTTLQAGKPSMVSHRAQCTN
jgi:hypothetical protein